ncbi:MAG: hypothetical protein ACE5EH_12370, partial [Gammaproteobacteria bacterium]
PGSGGGGTKTFYLGAIADYQTVIAEINENNNTAVQSSAGNPQAIPVSVATDGATKKTKGGGGSVDWLMLLVLIPVLSSLNRKKIVHL